VAADPYSVRKLPVEVAPDARALVESNNRFALDLYSRLRARAGNLFLSPHSISEAFGMVCAGAAGDTRAEIARVFHYDTLGTRLHPAFGALHRSLDRGVALGGYELHVANRMWLQRGFPVVPDFRDVTANHYLAGVDSADFETAAEPARLAINAWVEQQTRQKIRDLLQPGSVTGATRLVLANAIYFKGLWQARFDPKNTLTGTFHLQGGATAAVPMMSRTDTVQFGADADAQVLSLPYRGGDLSMVLVLPVAQVRAVGQKLLAVLDLLDALAALAQLADAREAGGKVLATR
jgi:serpin B